MLYLPHIFFNYTDSWQEFQVLGREIVDMDDDSLVDECKCVNIGKDDVTMKIIEQFENHGVLLPSDRQYLIGYYILSHIEETLEID